MVERKVRKCRSTWRPVLPPRQSGCLLLGHSVETSLEIHRHNLLDIRTRYSSRSYAQDCHWHEWIRKPRNLCTNLSIDEHLPVLFACQFSRRLAKGCSKGDIHRIAYNTSTENDTMTRLVSFTGSDRFLPRGRENDSSARSTCDEWRSRCATRGHEPHSGTETTHRRERRKASVEECRKKERTDTALRLVGFGDEVVRPVANGGFARWKIRGKERRRCGEVSRKDGEDTRILRRTSAKCWRIRKPASFETTVARLTDDCRASGGVATLRGQRVTRGAITKVLSLAAPELAPFPSSLLSRSRTLRFPAPLSRPLSSGYLRPASSRCSLEKRSARTAKEDHDLPVAFAENVARRERKESVELATPTPCGVALRPAAPRDVDALLVCVFTTAHTDARTLRLHRRGT